MKRYIVLILFVCVGMLFAQKAKVSAKKNVPKDNSEKVFINKMPQFPGGTSAVYDYLSRNIVYPAAAREAGIQGRVIVSFLIDRDGKVKDVRIRKSVDPELDEEAVRVVSAMPTWLPAVQSGRTVPLRVLLPVVFKLMD